MNSLLTDLSPRQLRQAADLKEKIESLQHDLSQILGSTTQPAEPLTTLKKKRKMSNAAIAKIRAAAKARWAKIKALGASANRAVQPKRKVSAATKAKLAAVARARWKKARAAGKNTL